MASAAPASAWDDSVPSGEAQASGAKSCWRMPAVTTPPPTIPREAPATEVGSAPNSAQQPSAHPQRLLLRSSRPSLLPLPLLILRTRSTPPAQLLPASCLLPSMLPGNSVPIQLSISLESALPPLSHHRDECHHPPSSPRPEAQQPSLSPIASLLPILNPRT